MVQMTNKFRSLQQLWCHFGPKWLAYRIGYAIRLRSGAMQRQLPATGWEAQPLRHFLSDASLDNADAYFAYRRRNSPPFFFNSNDRLIYQPYFAKWDSAEKSPQILGDEIANGKLCYFNRILIQTGFPPDWHNNPLDNKRAPSDIHWSQLGDFDYGDIKIIWEASRFGFAYTLVRAYWRTGDEAYAELFWRAIEDWRQQNPPQRGVNWKCGQETTFRVMAWSFALYGFFNSPTATAWRVAMLTQMIVVSGQRIEANLGYALSQKNNHGVSEGVGLWTIGMLFPELRLAAKWRETGRRVLEQLGRELIYDDGAFVQHSVNYHRLMLHDYLWALRLGDIHNTPFSDELQERVAKAGDFLCQLQDKESGRVPYYGQNDGALILPLNNCDYRDFRPVVQAIHYLNTRNRCYDDGAWDEDLLWLFGPQALESPLEKSPQENLQVDEGGYYTLRTPSSFAFVRCATYRHRPGQADMLHLDLWRQGQNVAIDAGTYSYNAPKPWDNSLARTAYHNTVTVDSLDQMDRVGKFLWLPWLRGQVNCNVESAKGQLTYWEGMHNGYQRLKDPVTHRRGILRVGDESWLVLDQLTGRKEHEYRLHWLFADMPYQWDGDIGELTLQMATSPYHVGIHILSGEGKYSLIRAAADSPRGWQSPYYNYREPALSVDMMVQAKSTLFLTLFGPEPGIMTKNETTLKIETPSWQGTINLHAVDDNQPTLFVAASVSGAIRDFLEIAS